MCKYDHYTVDQRKHLTQQLLSFLFSITQINTSYWANQCNGNGLDLHLGGTGCQTWPMEWLPRPEPPYTGHSCLLPNPYKPTSFMVILPHYSILRNLHGSNKTANKPSTCKYMICKWCGSATVTLYDNSSRVFIINILTDNYCLGWCPHIYITEDCAQNLWQNLLQGSNLIKARTVW